MIGKARLVRAALGGVLALAALGVAPAAAEPMLDLGQGNNPSGVTDAAGTLHVVWRDPASDFVPLMYCRVPAGGAGCTPVAIGQWADTSPQLMLRPQDGALIAVYPGLDAAVQQRTMMTASLDGGATWTPATPIGTGIRFIDEAALSPDGAFVDTIGHGAPGQTLFQRVSLAGGLEQRVVVLATESRPWSPHLSHLPDGRAVVTGHDAADRLVTRVAAAGADPDDPAAWSASTGWRRLAQTGPNDIDAGPTGTWLVGSRLGSDPPNRPVGIWRWGARGFERPRTTGALRRLTPAELGRAARIDRVRLDVDLAGRLHAAWELLPGSCGDHECIVYRRTDRNGFMAPIVYPMPTPDPGIVDFRLAANSGGSGWIVLGTNTSRVGAFPLVTPPRGSRVGSVRIGRLRVSVPDFYGCVPTGGTFVHRLRVDGRRGTRILSVRFFFDDGTPARTDRRAPYRLRFRLDFPPGTRHVAAAIVRYRLPGRSAVRSVRIGRTFVMC